MQKSPAECASMTDIRAEIDRLDKALMTLFAERWAYIGRAAEIKKPAGLKADIPARVDEVRRNARKNAEKAGLDPDFYDDIWARLIRHSIEHEQAVLGEIEK
ncbi:chorismate mutase family protein [Pararhizobium sp. BT-229]|uniref:chorismate mutase family protein n=1 Tax=Pararhizobium sp. BT-229 TaxID=2986923 RepID=UPI0021F79B65|nr:chorismate mutase family protein [Pararhizobium sp. BT-229]MCV9962640.1 chorismate mutase family protein [Pararhizobium sp. BT-229]